MKNFVILFILLSPGFVVAAPDINANNQEKIDYCHETDTLSVKLCAAEKLIAAEAELKELYSEQMHRLQNEEPKKRLRSSQQAWLEFRQKDCEYQGWATEQGSIHSLIVSECEIRHTEQRIKALKAFINCTQAGCPW
jgi:uncharacterized protein YecT (DUF1311 family)